MGVCVFVEDCFIHTIGLANVGKNKASLKCLSILSCDILISFHLWSIPGCDFPNFIRLWQKSTRLKKYKNMAGTRNNYQEITVIATWKGLQNDITCNYVSYLVKLNEESHQLIYFSCLFQNSQIMETALFKSLC